MLLTDPEYYDAEKGEMTEKWKDYERFRKRKKEEAEAAAAVAAAAAEARAAMAMDGRVKHWLQGNYKKKLMMGDKNTEAEEAEEDDEEEEDEKEEKEEEKEKEEEEKKNTKRKIRDEDEGEEFCENKVILYLHTLTQLK